MNAPNASTSPLWVDSGGRGHLAAELPAENATRRPPIQLERERLTIALTD